MFIDQRPGLAGALLITAILAHPLPTRAAAAADEVTRWNVVATTTAASTETDPLTESRIFAILHLAIHDAVNSVVRKYQPYALDAPAVPGASVDVAVAAAAREVLVTLLPQHAGAYAALYQQALARETDPQTRLAGIVVGRRAARAVLDLRAVDGANREVPYVPRDVAGDYRPTPPDLTPAMFVQWGGIAPFALQTASQFRPDPPPAPDSRRARAEVAEIRRIGRADDSTRTEEQSAIAKFWYENSTQGWNRVARAVLETRPMDAWDRARFYALVNIAMADGFIAGFEGKYHYRFWRPVTAIRDGGDATWLSFLPTPPVPEHPSTHTVLGAAAARTMARLLGTDLVSFTMESGAPYAGIRRQFWCLSEAARENGASRMLAGIHFRSAVDSGFRLGEQVADYAVDSQLRPLAAFAEREPSR